MLRGERAGCLIIELCPKRNAVAERKMERIARFGCKLRSPARQQKTINFSATISARVHAKIFSLSVKGPSEATSSLAGPSLSYWAFLLSFCLLTDNRFADRAVMRHR